MQVLRVRLKDSIVFVVVLYFIGGGFRGHLPNAVPVRLESERLLSHNAVTTTL